MREKKVDYWNGKTTEIDWKRGEKLIEYSDQSGIKFGFPIEDEDRQWDFFNNGEDIKDTYCIELMGKEMIFYT